MNSSPHEQPCSNKTKLSASFTHMQKNSRHTSGDVQAIEPAQSRRMRGNPLLYMPIGRRLALGFLLPALIAALTLSNVGIQSQQRLLQESTYYQNLLDTYTSLITASGLLLQMHTDLQAISTNAPQLELLRDDQTIVRSLSTRFETILVVYKQQGVLAQYPDLVTLFTEGGHGTQIKDQQTYLEKAQATWRTYRNLQERVLGALTKKDGATARLLVLTQEDTAFTDANGAFHTLISFNGQLGTSLHDAAAVEVQKLLISTLLAVLGVLLGIGLVGWLVSSTLVQPLKRLRSVAQTIARGEVSARLEIEGRDEIADVSQATNNMLDTLVGLLEKTERQRDELASAQNLQRLHQQLQQEHDALNEANARLAALATTDPLTSLPNHRSLLERIEKELERARRYNHPFSLLFFDGDHFKRVNDTYGHAVGDLVLREIGERAHSGLRAGDILGRYGGEEFLVLLPETGAEEAGIVAERMRKAVAALPLASTMVDGGITITISIGVASYSLDGQVGSELLEKADQAMYWAKRLGRNMVCTSQEAIRLNQDPSMHSTIHALERQEGEPVDGGTREQERSAEQLGLLYSLMWVIDLHNHDLFVHSYEVSDLASALARELGCNDQICNSIATAGLLHDIGKVSLSDALLEQPGDLSANEWALIQQHPTLGAQILEMNPSLQAVIPAVRHHHEHWDGSGYPEQLKGECIPLEARIIAVAEAYQTMIANRSYQVAYSQADACSEIRRCSGSQFDPTIVQAFLALINRQQKEADDYMMTYAH